MSEPKPHNNDNLSLTDTPSNTSSQDQGSDTCSFDKISMDEALEAAPPYFSAAEITRLHAMYPDVVRLAYTKLHELKVKLKDDDADMSHAIDEILTRLNHQKEEIDDLRSKLQNCLESRGKRKAISWQQDERDEGEDRPPSRAAIRAELAHRQIEKLEQHLTTMDRIDEQNEKNEDESRRKRRRGN